MLMILDDTSTNKTFTDDRNTVNIEYLIFIRPTINIYIHTDGLIVFYCIMSIQLSVVAKKLVLLLYIIVKILIKQTFFFFKCLQNGLMK